MILLDFGGVVFGSLHVDLKDTGKPNKQYIRHLCLNTIRFYNHKFRNEFGEMIICFDSRSWRELDFPYYKWVRRNTRKDDDLDWGEIWEIFKEIQEEIKAYFPFRTVEALGAEADDTIGVLASEAVEKCLVISNDKDFFQLSKLSNTKQFRPFNSEYYEVDDPERQLFELILTGDKDDGIPNVKCDGWFYIHQFYYKDGGWKVPRAPSISQKFKNEMWELFKDNGVLGLPDDIRENFIRNRKLICLDAEYIPDVVISNIHKSLASSKPNSVMKMVKFMQDNKMGILVNHVEDFTVNKIPLSF